MIFTVTYGSTTAVLMSLKVKKRAVDIPGAVLTISYIHNWIKIYLRKRKKIACESFKILSKGNRKVRDSNLTVFQFLIRCESILIANLIISVAIMILFFLSICMKIATAAFTPCATVTMYQNYDCGAYAGCGTSSINDCILHWE